jgi:hypothetical protein
MIFDMSHCTLAAMDEIIIIIIIIELLTYNKDLKSCIIVDKFNTRVGCPEFFLTLKKRGIM